MTSHPVRTVLRLVARGIGIGAFLLMLALAAVVVVIPSLTGSSPLTVLTGSMAPQLPPGTLVVVRPVDTAAIKIGDVVTYQITSGKPDVITHRVIGISAAEDGSREFITQGDANPSPDPKPVVPAQVKGAVWYSVPFVGWLSTAIVGSQRTWLMPVAGLGLLAFAAFSIVTGIRDAVRKARGRTPEVTPQPSA